MSKYPKCGSCRHYIRQGETITFGGTGKHDEKLSLITKNCEEVVTKERLQTLLESKDHPVAYIGYEPSGTLHLGHKIGIDKMRDLQAAGFETIILLADMHAYLNEKGELDDIRRIAQTNKKLFEALGLNGAKIVLGGSDEFGFSDKDGFQMTPDYWKLYLRLASRIPFRRAMRSVRELARDPEKMKDSHLIYPIMQVADMVELGVDLSVGGRDQRQLHMLADDSLPKIGYNPPVFLHMPIIRGIEGDKKMSSSNAQFLLALDDPLEKIEEKINRAFCPPRQIENNPVLQIAKLCIPEAWIGGLRVGNGIFKSYGELEQAFLCREISPSDLKLAIAEALIKILEPVRMAVGARRGGLSKHGV